MAKATCYTITAFAFTNIVAHRAFTVIITSMFITAIYACACTIPAATIIVAFSSIPTCTIDTFFTQFRLAVTPTHAALSRTSHCCSTITAASVMFAIKTFTRRAFARRTCFTSLGGVLSWCKCHCHR